MKQQLPTEALRIGRYHNNGWYGGGDRNMNTLENLFKKIHKTAVEEKTEVFVVGGYIRDIILGRPLKKDIDLVVVGSGLVFAKAFDKSLKEEGSLIEFPDFDTARYILPFNEGKIEIEFAGARAEKYEKESRKPKVESASLVDDLSRRDFTVNAMAAPVEIFTKKISKKTLLSKISDPFGGLKDIEGKILKTPLEPDVTFSDDPLRMLRAIRFAGQLEFSISMDALESIHKNRQRIKIVSGERIQEELLKMLSVKTPSICLMLLFQTKLLDEILPEVSALNGVEEVFGHQHKDNLVHSFKVVDNIAERSDNVWLRLAGLLHDIGKPGTKEFVQKVGWTFHAHEHLGKKLSFGIAKRLKFSRERTDYIAKLIRWHLQPISLMDEGITDSAVRRLIVTLGVDINDLLILGRGDITTGNPYKKEKRLKNYDNLEKRVAEVIEKDKLLAFQSPVRGDEIMSECHLKPGPTVGKIKTAIEEAILDGIIPNEYEPAKEYFNKIKEEYLKDAAEWEKA
jgi:tRNA nucleotidyltransferase/poly(A) polymerase